MKSRLHTAQLDLRIPAPQRGELPRLFNRGLKQIAASGAGPANNGKWMPSARAPLSLKESNMYDCIIIGTGVAGISAALTLKARGKSFLLLGSPSLSSKISAAELINNYPGLPAISGDAFRQALSAHLQSSGIEITPAQVTGVYDMGDHFGVLCASSSFEAKTIILATGVEAVKPIEGELEFLGRGVSYCATCDGMLYKGKKIVVVCTSKFMEDEVEYLSSLAAEVTFVPLYKGAEVEGANINYINDMPRAIKGDMRVRRVVFGKIEVECDGVFMLKTALAPSALVPGLKSREGHVEVDRQCRTNLSGLFAAGDCTGRPYQYAKAAGEGNVAAHSVCDYLSGKK